MMRAVIIDDESAARKSLLDLIQNHLPKINVVKSAGCLEEGVVAIVEEKPELIFLDIDMPDGTGFDLLERIDDINLNVIFTTAHEKYAHHAFKVSAIDYLLKPVNLNGLKQAIRKVEERQESTSLSDLVRLVKSPKREKIMVSTAEEVRLVDAAEVICIKADRNYCEIVLESGAKIMSTQNLAQLESRLDDSKFLRVHKSYIINFDFVEIYRKGRGGQIILTNGEMIEISRNKKNVVLEIMSKMSGR